MLLLSFLQYLRPLNEQKDILCVAVNPLCVILLHSFDILTSHHKSFRQKKNPDPK